MQGSVFEFDRLPSFGQPATRPVVRARAPVNRAVPLVGIIRNPRSHRNKGEMPELADCTNILTEVPDTRESLRACLERFARRGVDFIAVDGGDGTVRDVLTCGGDIFGDSWPRLIVLPKGKTNALAVDLGLPGEWSLSEAMAAAQGGHTVRRQPLRIRAAGDTAGAGLQGFMLGAGAFTIATGAGQEAHRRGAFNSFAVGLTILWGIFQALFGRSGNPWRASTPMRLVDSADGRELPRSQRGRPGERFLAIATTFERFPLGFRPFGRDVREGIKLGLMDWPVRWLVLLLPFVLMGLHSRLLTRHGAIRAHVDTMEFDLGGNFILDGESFPAGRYILDKGPQLTFVVP